jgi:hypothetical protein
MIDSLQPGPLQRPKKSGGDVGGAFQPHLVPPAATFYGSELGKLSRPNRAGWAQALCPFHPDRHPSLAVNVISGGFFCFGCGTRGGDSIDFLKLRYRISFKEAAQRLGAWRTDLTFKESIRLREQKLEQLRIQREKEKLIVKVNRTRLQVVAELRELEQFQQRIGSRLKVYANGAKENFRNEVEFWWQVSAGCLPRIRVLVAAYYSLLLGPRPSVMSLYSTPTNENRWSMRF